MTARFTVLEAGHLSSIQGAPRIGARRFGLPPSGAIDDLAHRSANAALGNAADAAVIEVSLGGLVIRCDEGTVDFALTGGSFSARCNGRIVAPWSCHNIGQGDVLQIRPGSAGNWGIIAFSSAIDARHWLGSASTHSQSGLGGGLLQAGKSFCISGSSERKSPGPIPMPTDRTGPLDLILGPQDHCFDRSAIAAFLETGIIATAAFDRMGIVIDGAIPKPQDLSILSEPAVAGAIQIDGSGRAVVLLNDHQTTGGYPKLGVIASYDLTRLAQARAGERFRLAPVTPCEALTQLRAVNKSHDIYLSSIRQGSHDLEAKLRSANLISGIIDGGR
jgi:5-oxoprolinase (ATP-hydrolysing) subunit C